MSKNYLTVKRLAPLLASATNTYAAQVVSVTDGDTLKCDIIVGHQDLAGMTLDVVARDFPVRLGKCNAWEKNTEAGKAAKANLALLLPYGTHVTLSHVVPYKYGMEIDADVALEDGQDLVTLLIAAQWLAPWSGLGVRPVPPWPRSVNAPTVTLTG